MADLEPRRGVSVSFDDQPEAVLELAQDGQAAADDGVLVLRDNEGEEALPKRARLQPDGSVILPLLYPRTLRFRTPGQTAVTEQEFAELHFHRLSGKEMRQIAAAEPADRAVLSLALCAGIKRGLMEALFDAMDAADCVAAGDVAGFFLASGRKTGR